MALSIITNLRNTDVQRSKLEENSKLDAAALKLLNTPEFIALITDIALVALAAVAITTTVLVKNGTNLGVLNAVGSLNLHSVYALAGVAGAIAVADIATLLAKRQALADVKILLTPAVPSSGGNVQQQPNDQVNQNNNQVNQNNNNNNPNDNPPAGN